MKIDLNKEEWELIYILIGNFAAFPDENEQLKQTQIALNIFRKLGSEWVDDEK